MIYTDFNDKKAGEFTVIQFDYEVEREPSIPGSLLWDILPTIESRLTQLLILELLPNCKGAVNAKNAKTGNPKKGSGKTGKTNIDKDSATGGSGRTRKLEELIGISSQPVDVLDSVCKYL